MNSTHRQLKVREKERERERERETSKPFRSYSDPLYQLFEFIKKQRYRQCWMHFRYCTAPQFSCMQKNVSISMPTVIWYISPTTCEKPYILLYLTENAVTTETTTAERRPILGHLPKNWGKNNSCSTIKLFLSDFIKLFIIEIFILMNTSIS